jgi:hypothetical protein
MFNTLFNNTICIENINNYNFDFKKLLKINDSIIWKNCNNLIININSKINKLIFENCKNIQLFVFDSISGIEINKSDIIININNSYLKLVHIFKSKIIIKYNKLTDLPIGLPTIINEFSNIKFLHND